MIREPLAIMSEAGRTYLQGSQFVKALEATTCEVCTRDRIAVVGPSGSGKSTLLHLIGGIDLPSIGNVEWPALGKREELRPGKVQYVFQSRSLLEALTVIENVEMPLLLSGSKPEAAFEAAFGILQSLGLQAIAEKLPEELSGGQAQRIAVARAIVTRPRLILADEPTGQLDHPTARHLFDVLLGSLESTDTALVVATHDAAIASRMDRVWKIEYGRVLTS